VVAPQSRALRGRRCVVRSAGPVLLGSWLRSLRASIRAWLGRILHASKRTGSEGQGSSDSPAPKPILDAFFHDFPPQYLYTARPAATEGVSESTIR
jgi:hypothetical protein